MFTRYVRLLDTWTVRFKRVETGSLEVKKPIRKLFGLGIIDLNMMVTPYESNTRWWFQIFSMFAAIWESDPTWQSLGWFNHQLGIQGMWCFFFRSSRQLFCRLGSQPKPPSYHWHPGAAWEATPSCIDPPVIFRWEMINLLTKGIVLPGHIYIYIKDLYISIYEIWWF